MEIDWSRVRRIILNHRVGPNRPSLNDIDSIVDHLPDAKILGFGKYGMFNTWYLVVESGLFPPFEPDIVYPMNLTALRVTYPKKRNRVEVLSANPPPSTPRPSG